MLQAFDLSQGMDAANKLLNYGSSPNPPYSGNTQVAYDIKGNTLTETLDNDVTAYTWDSLNRMTRWAKTNETPESYVYNGYGMRVRKMPDGGTPTDFLLDGKEIAEEITGENVTSYVGPGLISSISGSTRLQYHADGIGSTRAMTNNYADVTQAEIYDAYGNRRTTSGTSPTFGFVGRYRYYTDSVGLQYLKHRYYGSMVGRFLSRDPIGYADGPNLYAYSGNNPITYVDPDGETKDTKEDGHGLACVDSSCYDSPAYKKIGGSMSFIPDLGGNGQRLPNPPHPCDGKKRQNCAIGDGLDIPPGTPIEYDGAPPQPPGKRAMQFHNGWTCEFRCTPTTVTLRCRHTHPPWWPSLEIMDTQV